MLRIFKDGDFATNTQRMKLKSTPIQNFCSFKGEAETKSKLMMCWRNCAEVPQQPSWFLFFLRIYAKSSLIPCLFLDGVGPSFTCNNILSLRNYTRPIIQFHGKSARIAVIKISLFSFISNTKEHNLYIRPHRKYKDSHYIPLHRNARSSSLKAISLFLLHWRAANWPPFSYCLPTQIYWSSTWREDFSLYSAPLVHVFMLHLDFSLIKKRVRCTCINYLHDCD